MLGTAISAAAGAFPETVSQLYNCFKEGDLTQARKIQDRLMAYREFVVTHPALSVVKEALEYRGFATGGLRPPLHMLCEDHKKQLHELIENLELVP